MITTEKINGWIFPHPRPVELSRGVHWEFSIKPLARLVDIKNVSNFPGHGSLTAKEIADLEDKGYEERYINNFVSEWLPVAQGLVVLTTRTNRGGKVGKLKLLDGTHRVVAWEIGRRKKIRTRITHAGVLTAIL